MMEFAMSLKEYRDRLICLFYKTDLSKVWNKVLIIFTVTMIMLKLTYKNLAWWNNSKLYFCLKIKMIENLLIREIPQEKFMKAFLY